MQIVHNYIHKIELSNYVKDKATYYSSIKYKSNKCFIIQSSKPISQIINNTLFNDISAK